MSVTLKQIAKEVGVSHPIVSCALNGKPGVGPAMRSKIIETAERMGYDKRSNPEARRMIAQRFGKRMATGSIAFAYTVVDNFPWLNDPFNRALVNGAMYEAGERQLDLHFTPHRPKEIPRIAAAKGVDGIILQHWPSDELCQLKVPIVLLCGYDPQAQCLVPDWKSGIYLTTKHLLNQGHRRIAYVGAFSGHRIGDQGLAGYKRALAEYSVPVNQNWIIHADDSDQASGSESMGALRARSGLRAGESPFTAVVCFNDILAMGVVRKALQLGLRVPQDLSVTGFDDISREYHFYPELTSTRIGHFEIGRRAVEWICEETQRLISCDEAGREGSPLSGVETFPAELVVRDSTQPHGDAGDE